SATPTQGSMATPESGETLNLEGDILGGDPFDAYKQGKGGQVWTWVIICSLLVILATGATSAYWLLQPVPGEHERLRRELAQEAYQQSEYDEAAHLFDLLKQDFPDSSRRDYYDFMSRLAQAQAPIHEPHITAEGLQTATKDFLRFLRSHRGNSSLKESEEEVWVTLQRAAVDLTAKAREKKKSQLLDVAKTALNAIQAEKLKAPKGEEILFVQAAKAHKETEEQFLYWENRERLIASLKAIQRTSGNLVARSQAKLAPFTVLHPDLATDPEVTKLLDAMPRLHLQSIAYTTSAQAPVTANGLAALPSLLFLRDTGASANIPDVPAGNVFSIVQGVLYSIDARKGTVRWAKRIGLDTVSLPVRLPMSSISTERLLYVANNAERLVMVRADNGQELWQRDLGGVCPGKPVLVGNRAFVGLDDGRVLEIETTSGTLLGEYDLGQRLTGWGVHHPETSLVYFPAEQDCVFVLDVEKQKCTHIFYSEHSAGSLIGSPVVIPTESNEFEDINSGLLVLNEANGLDNVRWRILKVPPNSSESLATTQALSGWAWFPPTHKAGKIASVTDNGHFSLLQVEQPLDPERPFVTEFEKTFSSFGSSRDLGTRSQIVAMTNNTTWAMIHGRLRKFHAGYYRDGYRIRPLPLKSAFLGTPLHASETRRRENDNHVFYLTTRRAGSHALWALDSYSGATLWEKRIGLRVEEPPIGFGQKLACVAPNGEILLLDRNRSPKTAPRWSDGMKATTLLPKGYGPIGTQADLADEILWVLGSPTKETPKFLQLRRFDLANPKLSSDINFQLDAPLQGTPAIGKVRDSDSSGKTWLVVPLANDTLVRKASDGLVERGPTWRSPEADKNAPCHVAWVQDNYYLVTDGSRGIKLYLWADKIRRDKLADATLEGRILKAPVLLSEKKGSNSRVLLADKSNKVTLWDAMSLGEAPIREWSFQGELSRGPFLRKDRFALILDETRLLWFDPNRTGKLWEYVGTNPIVGEPELIDGKLVVADIAGRVVVLNTTNGKIVKEVETLVPTAAPLTTPVEWSDGWAFIPLTDGTAVWWPIGSKTEEEPKPKS
ncbi:MAG: PQQ-binding-like beta-propeller repeat protein, partial [Gemmataceae bacterium]